MLLDHKTNTLLTTAENLREYSPQFLIANAAPMPGDGKRISPEVVLMIREFLINMIFSTSKHKTSI